MASPRPPLDEGGILATNASDVSGSPFGGGLSGPRHFGIGPDVQGAVVIAAGDTVSGTIAFNAAYAAPKVFCQVQGLNLAAWPVATGTGFVIHIAAAQLTDTTVAYFVTT